MSDITDNSNSSKCNVNVSTSKNPKVRRTFKCPFKSPISTASDTQRSSLSINKGNIQTLDSNECKLSPQFTPKRFKLSNNRNTSYQSPFRSPLLASHVSPTDLKDKLSTLEKREELLDKEIAELEAEGFTTEKVQEHINDLHKYNEIKDSAQIVLGKLAEMFEISIKEIHLKYNAPTED